MKQIWYTLLWKGMLFQKSKQIQQVVFHILFDDWNVWCEPNLVTMSLGDWDMRWKVTINTAYTEYNHDTLSRPCDILWYKYVAYWYYCKVYIRRVSTINPIDPEFCNR